MRTASSCAANRSAGRATIPTTTGPNERGLSAYHIRLLAGALASAAGRGTEPARQREIERYRPQLEAYEQFCRELGEGPADVALAWALHNPVVAALITGPQTLDQLTGRLRALSITLSADALARLDASWPGPGEAPEAYAW